MVSSVVPGGTTRQAMKDHPTSRNTGLTTKRALVTIPETNDFKVFVNKHQPTDYDREGTLETYPAMSQDVTTETRMSLYNTV